MKNCTLFILALLLVFKYSFTSAQIITTIAGNGTFGHSGDGGAATLASLYSVGGVAVDSSGNIYISTVASSPTGSVSKVRKVNVAGTITTFAGIDTVGFSGDGGPATAARLSNPNCLAFDKKGNVYIGEMAGNRRVRKVDPAGIITTFAGNGSSTPSGDGGPATAAGLGGVPVFAATWQEIFI